MGAGTEASGPMLDAVTHHVLVVEDEADIAFRPMPMAVDKEHSWRWGEQWMPHAAWLLDALVLGNR